MPRAPFQVLVVPFRVIDNSVMCCVFRRSDMNDIYQFIAGGGEDDETPLAAARREAYEEAGISKDVPLYALDTRCSISADFFSESTRKIWGESVFVVPEYTFAAEVNDGSIRISQEHLEYEWLDISKATSLLKYDSN